MSLKPKTVRRLLLLSGIIAVAIVAVFSLVVVRRWQTERLMAELRADGLAALEEGEHFKALNDLAHYIRRHDDDPEAIKAYADARSNVEEADGRHLLETIGHYRRYLELNSGDRDAKIRLLGFYNQVRHFPEARDLAEHLRPALDQTTPEHAPVLKEECIALLGLLDKSDRLPRTAERLVQLVPSDIDAQMIRLEVIAKRQGAAAAQTHADGLMAAHPDDPRFILLGALGRLTDPKSNDLREIRTLLCRAAGLSEADAKPVRDLEPQDPAFVRLLVQAFDRMHLYAHSLAVLDQAAPAMDDLQLKQIHVRRLWQDGRFADVERLTAGLDPARWQSDATRLGFRALTLAALGRADEAANLADALAARQGDFRAEAWSHVIPLADRQGPAKLLDALTALQHAVETDPLEPVHSALLADVYATLHRSQDARAAWKKAVASPIAAGWVQPRMRIAETLLAEGRVEEAVSAATDALITGPGKLLANLVWLEAHAARIDRGLPGQPGVATLLAHIDEIESRLAANEQNEATRPFRERLLCCRVGLLASTGDIQSAAAAVQAALDAAPPPSLPTLLRLATLSEHHALGLADRCLAAAEQTHGPSLQLAITKATRLAMQGRFEDGRRLLEQARTLEGVIPQRHGLAMARFLEAARHPDAAAAWIALGDTYPQDLEVQRSCLASGAAASDRAFIDRTVQRFRDLVGRDAATDNAQVRIARARALLAGRPGKRERDDAIALLNSVLGEAPSMIEPRLLLASALRIHDPARGIDADLPGAAAHLASAARLDPSSAPIALELARTLQAQRDFVRARDQLRRIAGNPAFSASDRRAAAELLVAQGDASLAIATLTELAENQGSLASPDLLGALAVAHVAAQQDDKAGMFYERITAHPDATGRALLNAATFFASRNDDQRAQAALSRLPELGLSEGEQHLLRARFHAMAGDPDEAARLFEQAAAASPADPNVWLHFAAFHSSRGEFERAAAVAERARRTLPDNAHIAILHERSRVLLSPDVNADLGPLIRALAADPAQSGLSAPLESIEQLRQSGQFDDPAALAKLAERFPGSLPLQMFVARRLAGLEPPALERAASIAIQAVQGFPTRAEPAELACRLYMAMGRWEQMLAAASEWRRRDLARSIAADLAVAQANVALGRSRPALDLLAPRLDEARKDPDAPASFGVIDLYARALVGGGRAAEARQLLEPLLSSSPAILTRVWLDLAGRQIATAEEAIDWVREAEPYLRADTVEDQLALAAALASIADRFPDAHADRLGEAHNVLANLASGSGGQNPIVHEALGITRHRAGDISGAEQAYRRALELDSSRSIAANNLATILMERGELAAALDLASRAVELGGPYATANLGTLAAVQRLLGQREADAGNTEAARNYFAAAAASYAQLHRARPHDTDTLSAWADTARLAGDSFAETTAYERLLQTPGLSPEIAASTRNNFAHALLKRGDPSELHFARQLASAAVAARPDSAEFHDTLGWIQAAAGDLAAAESAFREALRLNPQLLSAVIGLADVLARGDDPQRSEAAELLRRAAVVHPDAPLDEHLESKLRDTRASLGLP